MSEPAHVATLLCDPSFPALTERHLARAAERLEAAHEPHWLAQGVAADIAFAPSGPVDLAALTEALRVAIADKEIDVVVQPFEGRRKKLLFVEMDQVLLGQNTSDEIAAVTGTAAQRAEIGLKVAAGEISFAEGLEAFFALLHGRTSECLQQVLTRRMQMRGGARLLVETLRAHGATLAVATYGFSCFAGPVAQKLTIETVAANRLILEGRKIEALAPPLLDPAAKTSFLAALQAARNVAPAETMIVSAGAADISLFGATAATGLAFHAEAPLAAATSARIDRGDLTALLYVQGFSTAEFIGETRQTLDASDWKRKYGAFEKAHERTRL